LRPPTAHNEIRNTEPRGSIHDNYDEVNAMLAYVNGEFVPEDEATISIRDRGFTLGDGVYDVWRTYGGRTVRAIAERHLTRLRHSINYLELPGSDIVAQVDAITSEIVERNRDAIDSIGDVWVFTFVTRGVGIEGLEVSEPTIVVMCNPIPVAQQCPLEWYETGVHLISSLVPRNPFLPVDPRVKSISRLAYVRAQQKMARSEPGNWAVIFDNEGYITEAVAAALCIVEGETIVHAPRWKMLPSVSLQVFSEMGAKLGIAVEERPLTMYDYLNADEAYVLATSFGAFPVVDLDGAAVKRAGLVGPKIMREWVDHVGFDFMHEIHGSSIPSGR
jgi:branched-subunit amino acid aminotransferase/4-amino-4-deoxychorismate lyase